LAAALPLLGQGPEVRRQLTGMGRRSRDEWTDFVRDAHDFSDIRRQQMVNAIYDTRVQAAENALTKELGRTQLIRPADRAALRYRVGPDSPMGQKIRRRAEQQTDRIIATDRKFREDWAAKAKRRKYPLQNRYQINRELEQRLEARSPWKSEQITDTEYQQAGSEAISDFYGETEIADPEADAFWYFVGPSAHDPRTCPICRSVLAGQPYTREGLVAALASAGAMAPEVFTAHPHERHQAQFKPPAGWVRRGDNTDAARGWATMNGDLEDVRTGELIPIDPPRTTPSSSARASRRSPTTPTTGGCAASARLARGTPGPCSSGRCAAGRWRPSCAARSTTSSWGPTARRWWRSCSARAPRRSRPPSMP